MVGGGNRITYNEQKILEIMAEYKERKKKSEIFNEADEEIEFLDKCIKTFDLYERDLLEKTCIEKVSIRRYSKISGFSRNYVTKQRNQLLSLIARFFTIMFPPARP